MKKIFLSVAAFTVAAVAAFNVSVSFNSQGEELSSVILANVEALAQETGSRSYYCWHRYTSGISPTRLCPSCTSMWFTSGVGSVDTCRK